MRCIRCAGCVVKEQDTSYEAYHWRCINCGWTGRAYEHVPDHLCAIPGCCALLEPGWTVCQRHHYEAEVEAETVGHWSQQAKANLRAKRQKTLSVPFNPILLNSNGKATALKNLREELAAVEARKVAIVTKIASLEAL